MVKSKNTSKKSTIKKESIKVKKEDVEVKTRKRSRKTSAKQSCKKAQDFVMNISAINGLIDTLKKDTKVSQKSGYLSRQIAAEVKSFLESVLVSSDQLPQRIVSRKQKTATKDDISFAKKSYHFHLPAWKYSSKDSIESFQKIGALRLKTIK